ncbi:MAG: bis(5-nucleosidyl)-tetraphosphatase [Archaeoglobi archaeon]|nr:bis(5-nucleosidyl)-tetraphosphatase [Archaeoglobi archaeon]MDK2781578.1 bis(5-nucleosidyl)-tetraphosphatase [Archaeoglobi archaeon]
MRYERSAGAVIFRRNEGRVRYLLLHYPAGHWDFVKGNIEKGESEVETVRRETEEETGISRIKIFEGFREEISYKYRRDNELIHKEVVFYLAETDEEEVTLSYEHTGFKWLSYEDAMKTLTYENAREVLRKARALLLKLGIEED